ncbi:MAG: thiosulfohydrolase SoxB [Chromatiales bacterium 21-64-14]|nr:MAG: thiosulfohydrolase SoxB [Chromatiales bacterium 21-64-14]
MSRREFLRLLAIASAAGIPLSGCGSPGRPGGLLSKDPTDPYELRPFGNVSVLHFTDCHAQLLPVYFREPNVNLGVGTMKNHPPHLVGEWFLKYYGVPSGSRNAHAYTYLDFVAAAHKYGALGGFAHLATLVKRLRAQRPGALLLDGGDTWQGSATSLWTRGQDMVGAQLQLGVDVTTGHWEFTYGADRVKEIVDKQLKGKIHFLAQNIVDNQWGDAVFEPYIIREMNGVPVAIIGQAFPFTPIANPRYMIPDWRFGIREDRMQKMVNQARGKGAQAVILLSHNGMDVDLKLASRIRGIDAIMGGHTHDAVPRAVEVGNAGGKTLVINAGSNGKFLGVLDLDVRNGRVQGYQFKLLPVFSNLLPADPAMSAYIEKVRAPYEAKLNEPLATTHDLLYRRGNFNGTFDQVICDALRTVKSTQIAFSPGFRWGISVLPGETVTMEQLLSQTAITYPVVTRNLFTGTQIKGILEDIADNLFNRDPYYQQGGDMIRVGGMHYTMDPTADIGHRISDMELDGKPIDAHRKYSVAGWANVTRPLEGQAIWEVVSEYMKDQKVIDVKGVDQPKLKNITGNHGYAT